jgi:uncharacterized protein YndB with AHSA1/START domain
MHLQPSRSATRAARSSSKSVEGAVEVNVVDAGPRRISRSVEVAAPAEELYAMVADPRRHHELDGSGTVRTNITAPAKLIVGSRFSTHMKALGVPYRITSTVTALEPNAVAEWRHPVGHHWRWEFHALSPTKTLVTETFDYHDAGRIKNAIGYYHVIGATRFNVTGIESTLSKLRDRYAQA